MFAARQAEGLRLPAGYPLAKPLVFEPQDSGTSHAPTTYAAALGARPVLSGGGIIRNWKWHNASTWVAQVPEAKMFEGMDIPCEATSNCSPPPLPSLWAFNQST